MSIAYREAPAQKDNALPAFELFKWRCAQPFWRVDFSDYAHNISLDASKGGRGRGALRHATHIHIIKP